VIEQLVEDLTRIFHWTMAILVLQLCLMVAWVQTWRAVQDEHVRLAFPFYGWARPDDSVTTGACHGDAMPQAPQPEGETE